MAQFVERKTGNQRVGSSRLSPASQCCVLGHDTLYTA